MTYNEFVYHLLSRKDLDSFLTKAASKEFIVINFLRLIRENISINLENIDFVFNYYNDLYYKFFIAKILNEEKTKVEYFLKIDFTKLYDVNKNKYLYDVIIKFDSDESKLKLAPLITDKDLKSKIYLSLKNKELIKENIHSLTHEDGLSFLLSLSDEEKIEYINKGYYVAILIFSLSIENFYKEFGLISDANKIECIDKIDIPSVKFEILKEYKNLFTQEILFNYMSKIYIDTPDPNLRKKIQEFLNNEAFDTIIYSNTTLNKKKDLNGLNPLMYDINLSKNYSIGVELETSHKYYQMFLNLGYMLFDWVLKEETTVTNGVEINSNIMHYNKKSLRELLYVCNFLNENNFKVNDECSNHIHIGFDVFRSVKEIKTLLELFANNENIFYMMANEKESLLRQYYASYARPISIYLENAIGMHKFSNTKELYDFITELINFQEDKMVAINFFNAFSLRKNTIEFRISNGQIKYEEILLNMILYLKLVDIAINNKKIDKKLYEYVTSINVPEEERKTLLLNLLFHENRVLIDKFNERYETNNEINSKLHRVIYYNRHVRF